MSTPFPELESYLPGARAPRQPTAVPTTSTWLDREMERQRDEQIRDGLITAPPPDTVARTEKIARQTGSPVIDVMGNEEMAERGLQVQQLVALAQSHAPFGRWAAQNPRGAAMAADDTESLGALGTAWDFISNIPGRFANVGLPQFGSLAAKTWASIEEVNETVQAPVNAGMAALAQATGFSIFDPEPSLNARARRRRDVNQAWDDDVAQGRAEWRGGNMVSEGLLQGIDSLPMTIAAIATRNPNLATGTMGTLVGGGAYQDGKSKGLSTASAIPYAVLQGGTEALTERLPAGALVDMIARKTPFGKSVMRELGHEFVGENVATFFQDLADWTYLPENREKTIADFAAERPQAAVDTSLAVLGGSGTTVGVIGAVQRTADATASVAGRVRESRQAKRERAFLDQAAKAADGSKLKQRDPESFRALVRQQAEAAGAASVFIPGAAIQSYNQSEAYDPENDPLARTDAQEAAASGGDVVMPIEDFLTDVVGTPAWEAIKDDVRLTQGGMSTREAQTFDEAMGDLVTQAADELAQSDRADRAARSVREQLVDRVAGMFGESFTSPVARQYAEIAVQRAQTRAQRLGTELTAQDLDDLIVRQILPESVGEAVSADRLDLVINALRTGANPTYGVGPTLLEFILHRGGVSDVGGDLASMGVPARFLTGYDPRQGDMVGGVSGMGDLGLDNTLQAAIAAGYFPDLANVENEQGPSTLDTQRLIAAIGEELAGRPAYTEVRTDDVRASAEDLREALEAAGYAPQNMTDDDIRDAVARMSVNDGSADPSSFRFDQEGLTVHEDDFGGDGALFTYREGDSAVHGVARMTGSSLDVDVSGAGANSVGAAFVRRASRALQDAFPQAEAISGWRTSGARSEAAEASARVRRFNQEARGRVTFEQNRRIIELFKGRDLSTPIHELGHTWLEELRADAALDAAPDQLRTDWEVVRSWFAHSGHAIAEDGAIPVEAHELFARGIERYFMEGKAPTPALTRIFDNVRQWMLSIYRSVANLRSEISPEIREVFDRMLASDEEIAAARERQGIDDLFKDAADAGMTKAEFAAYQAKSEDARAAANAKLLERVMATIRRRETDRYREARRAVRAEEMERIDASPVFRALAAMDTKRGGDRISHEWIADRLGLDALDLLPRRVPPIYVEGGVNPDVIAEISGYASGIEMLQSLIGAERSYREAKQMGDKWSMRARAIDIATDTEMARRYGDPLNDGSIEEEALAAVQSEMLGEVIASEIRALGRKAGRGPLPYQAARDWARGKVRSGRWIDEVAPGAIQRHARNAAKAGRLAEEALAKGDHAQAYRQKQFQMLNSALVTEAKAASEEVESAVKRMDKIARAKTRKSVDQDYLEQAQALLEAVDLRRRSQVYEKRKGSFAAWAQARQADGYEVLVPDSFAETLEQTNWTKLPVETLLTLDETVKQIMHLGRLKQTLLDNQAEREWDAIIAEAVAGAGNLRGKPPADLAAPRWWQSIGSGIARFDSALLKLEQIFDWLDGGNSNGVFNRIAFRPIADAQIRENDMLKDYYARTRSLFEAVPAETLQRWQDILTPPFVDIHTERPMRLNRQQVVAMALNIGNEGNLQRLADGYGINQGALLQYIDNTLTADEWQFVQGVWDTIDTLWPEIEGLERRVNGFAPEKIEARSFETRHGPMKGGYYPAIYDPTRDYRAEENSGKENDLFEGRYTRATTRSSSTKERSEKVKRPILLDLGVINRHLGEVIHDITHREAVIRANRFLSSERVRRAVDEALGPQIGGQFRPWVKHVANSWASDRAGNEGFAKVIRRARTNATMVGMGFRATTIISQLSGYANSMEAVGIAPMAKAITHFLRNPVALSRMVLEKSPEVRQRMDTIDRDIAAEIRRLSATNPASKLAAKVVEGKQFAFHFIGLMDRVVSIPTWLAGYNNGLEQGLSEQDAIYAGDKAVRASQGAGGAKDLAAVQRGTGKLGEAGKLLTMFYSFLSMQYQRERNLARDVMGLDSRAVRSMPKLMARAMLLFVVGPLLTDLLRGLVGAPSGPEDDEWWAQWLARKLLSNAVAPIPAVRDLFEPAWNKAIKGRFATASITPVQRAYDSIVNVFGDAGRISRGEETKHATKDVLEAAGYATGLVPGQVASAAQFVVDWSNGDVDPDGPAQVLEGLSTGKIRED